MLKRVFRHLRDTVDVFCTPNGTMTERLRSASRLLDGDRALLRQQRTGFTPYLRAQYQDRVNLEWWSYLRDPQRENFGDALSPFVFAQVAQLCGIDVNQQVSRAQQICAIGSLLQGAETGSVIWGTGYEPTIAELPVLLAYKLNFDVRAVRGPLTRWELLRRGIDCPQIFGDPAILLPQFFRPEPPSVASDVVVIPHMVDHRTAKEAQEMGLSVVSPMATDWRIPVQQIAHAKLVISSSLHGIIVAEAYGVPAIHVSSPDVPAAFKFLDYYLSTGRPQAPRATSLGEALAVGEAPAPLNLDALRTGLIDAFPTDLWSS